MNDDFDITIVTPSLNQSQFIKRTITSVIEQKGINLQYIIVDGSSTDGTCEILESYRGKVDKLIVEPDQGQADAIAKGFTYAKGRICCYLNSDDYFLAGTLKRVMTYFDLNPDVDVIYSHRVFVDAKNRFSRYWILPRHSNYLMKRWDYIPQECTFWRREAMELVGGIDPRWDFAMDYDFFVRLMNLGCSFVRVNTFFAVFREHQNSKTTCLMKTIGMSEVDSIRTQHNIGIKWHDTFLAILLHWYISTKSILYKFINGPPKNYAYEN